MASEKQLYQILSTVSLSRSLTDVANKLFISEPYISKVIKNTEKKYNMKVIDKDAKPIRLTKAGEVLLDDLRKIVEMQNQMIYDIAPYNKDRDYEVKIGMNQPWLETTANKLIKYLVSKYPEITFSFYERTTNVAQDALLTHNLDIFIGKYLTNKLIKSVYVAQSELYLVIPPNFPLFNSNTDELTAANLKMFDNLSYISLTDNSFFETMIDNFYQEHRVNLNKIVKVENLLASIKLAVKKVGYTIVVESLAKKAKREYGEKIKLIHIPKNLLELSIGVSSLTNSHDFIENLQTDIISYTKNNPFF